VGDGYDWRRPKMKTKKYAELPKLLACYKAFCVENCIPIYVSSSGRRQQRILLDCGWMGEMAHSKARMPWRPYARQLASDTIKKPVSSKSMSVSFSISISISFSVLCARVLWQ